MSMAVTEFAQDAGDGGWVGPDLKTRNKRAQGLDQPHGGAGVDRLFQLDGLRRWNLCAGRAGSSAVIGSAECRNDGEGLRAYDENPGEAFDGGEFDVVHDDEPVEVLADGFQLRAVRFQQKSGCTVAAFAIHRRISLDASLRVEQEVIGALARLERLDRIADHPIQPARG